MSTEKHISNPFEICQRYIEKPDTIYMLGKLREKFSTTIKIMFDAIAILEKNEVLSGFEYGPIEECLNYLLSLIIEKKMDEDLSLFISNFIFLAHNLNNNLGQHKAVTKKIEYLQRYATNSLTLAESMNITKLVSKRAERWKTWLPPSFRLSNHYYSLLKEE